MKNPEIVQAGEWSPALRENRNMKEYFERIPFSGIFYTEDGIEWKKSSYGNFAFNKNEIRYFGEKEIVLVQAGDSV